MIVRVCAAIAVVVSCGCGAGPAAPWPSRPVRLVVPFGTGNSTDLAARLFAAGLAKRWHRPVVVDNRPGGDGVAGVQAFVSSADGHTLLFSPMGVVTANPLLHERLPFDPAHDVVPIAAAARPSIAIAAAGGAGVTTLEELVAAVRREPGRLLWTATPGLPELVFRAFLSIERLQMTHVPYRDIAPAVRDLAAGRVHLMIAALPTLMPVVEAGNVRLLAVTTRTRAPLAPAVPTTTEVGYPQLTVEGPFGFFGWRDMPRPLRDRIAGDVRAVAADPELVTRLSRAGFVVEPGTPDDFARSVETQRAQARRLVGIVNGLPTAKEQP